MSHSMVMPKKKDSERASENVRVRVTPGERRELEKAAKKRFEGNVSKEIRARCFPVKVKVEEPVEEPLVRRKPRMGW